MSGFIQSGRFGVAFATITDSFNRADNASSMGNADTGQTWVPNSGTWGIATNKARCQGGQHTTVIDSGISDVAVTVTPTSSGPGVCWRAVDSNNFWLTIGSQVYKKVAGSFTLKASLSPSYTGGEVVRVEAVGDSHKVFVNGVQACSFTDASLQTATKHGLYANGTQDLNDFSIAAM